MQKKSLIRYETGFGLIEVIVAAGIIAVLAATSATYFVHQLRANNFLEFQGKREQLRLSILGQFLSDPNQCKCLFAGTTFATPGPSALSGGTPPTSIDKYSFGTPGNCATATPSGSPFVNSAGVDNVALASVQLNNITGTPGNYQGSLIIGLQSQKPVAGPQTIFLTFPVSVVGSAGGPGTVVFQGCSSLAAAAVVPIVGTCPAGQFSTGYDAYGVLQCGPPTYQ
jgi:type II secretory pathway pseudopilin PulG